jgi:hypothetical protein
MINARQYPMFTLKIRIAVSKLRPSVSLDMLVRKTDRNQEDTISEINTAVTVKTYMGAPHFSHVLLSEL